MGRIILASVEVAMRLLVFVGVIAMTGCGEVSLQWSEEIELDNGQVVVAKRTAKAMEYSELGGPKSWDQPEMSVVIIKVPDEIVPPPSGATPTSLFFLTTRLPITRGR